MKKQVEQGGGRWPGKTGGAFGFALIPIAIGILWLLSFFQEKESNNAATGMDLIDEIRHTVQ